MLERKYTDKDIEVVFKQAGAKLNRPVQVILIGGCAMTFRNLKPSTKDVDLLFEDDVSEKTMFEALKEVGFVELFPGSYQFDLKAKDILINKDGLQFDLFTKIVMGGLHLTSAIQKRAEKYGHYGKLTVGLASKEDIYLFKAITTRPFPRDYEDLITLQQSGLDWKAIISENNAQIKGRTLEENLKKKLAELKKSGFTNPLMRKVGK